MYVCPLLFCFYLATYTHVCIYACITSSSARLPVSLFASSVVPCRSIPSNKRNSKLASNCGVISPLLSLEHALGLSAVTKTIPLINECFWPQFACMLASLLPYYDYMSACLSVCLPSFILCSNTNLHTNTPYITHTLIHLTSLIISHI